MIKHYLKIAIRIILKYKAYSFINILGLSVGIACSILILLFVTNELSFDKFYNNSERIYRVAVRASIGDTKIHQTYSSAATFLKLLEDFPEIEKGVKFLNFGRTPVQLAEQTFYEVEFYGVDSTFFNVFSIPLIDGNTDMVLTKPNTMVITESTALKYFNTIDVVGKVLRVPFSWGGFGDVDFEITGVSEDVPENSHFHYDILVSLVSFPSLINNQGWTSNNFIAYLLLKDGTSNVDFNEKLKDFTRKYMGGDEFDAWVEQGNYWEYFLQPLTDIHLNSDLNGEFETNGNKTYVYVFSLISIIILLIACINFMNLSSAKSSLRAKEVGIRKVVGSGRKKLVRQFLSESVLLSFISLIIGMMIVESLLPMYRNLIDRQLEIHYFDNLIVIPSLIGLALVVGIISGSYPAFVLSSIKTLTVLKGNITERKGGTWLRNILVIFQFTISIFLIIGTMIVFQQIKYFQNTNLGFNKEQVLVINNPGALGNNYNALKESLLKHSSITNISGSSTLPGRSHSNWGFGAEGIDEGFTLNTCVCDYDFLNTLEIELSQGRFFSRDFRSDSCAAIINEKTVELLGWEEPIGKRINNWSSNRGNFIIVGVIKDYHYESLHQEVRPMALFLNGGYFNRVENCISIRFQTEDVSETVKYVEETWNNFAPNMPFEYTFLDDDYDNLYINEKQTRKLFSIFSILAIFIACLGLFGLASFTADQRTKEIGIRKVLGASVTKIVNILNRSFTIWVLISTVIAWPLAGFVMNKWLQNFAYRIKLSWWMFVLAALLAIMIALVIVSLQTVRAALKNPADSLKYE